MKAARDGFTLLEVLIALAILAVMAYGIGMGMMQTRNNQVYTKTIGEYHLVMQSLSARHLTGQALEGALPAQRNPWTLLPVAITGDEFELYSLSHVERPSLAVKLAFRVAEE